MLVTFELPEELARLFEKSPGGVSQAAVEALVLEGVRSGKLSEARGRGILGFGSRYEMDGFLKAHGVMLPITASDLERDAQTAGSFARQ